MRTINQAIYCFKKHAEKPNSFKTSSLITHMPSRMKLDPRKNGRRRKGRKMADGTFSTEEKHPEAIMFIL